MAQINDDGQWIILIGFIVCASLFFLAIIVNESTIVGQTTAEGVLEFPKHDIQDLHHEILRYIQNGDTNFPKFSDGIKNLSLKRRHTIVNLEQNSGTDFKIHFNNGVTVYDENASFANL